MACMYYTPHYLICTYIMNMNTNAYMCVYSSQIRGAVVAKFEPKYQNSSLRAIADSSSLLTRLRVVGRARERETLSRTVVPGRESQSQQYSPRQQWLRNGQRVEARNRLTRSEQLTGEATSIDCKYKLYQTLAFSCLNVMCGVCGEI